ALAFAVAFSLAACAPSDDANTQASGADATAPAAAGDKVAAQITGAGATFIFPLITQWSADYHAATGNKINYQSIGSGGGIAAIKAGTVAFGSSDAPLAPEDLASSGLVQFPSVIGGVVPVVNVPGVEPGRMRLDGTLLADIFLGRVTAWNDARIVA